MENAIEKAMKKELELETPQFELMPESHSTNDDQYDGGFHVARRAAPARKVADRSVNSRSSLQTFTFE